MSPDRVGAVVNPASGGGDVAELFADLAQWFPDATVDARITAGPTEVHDAAVEQAEWADLLAVIGGDGTVREVAAALLDADLRTPAFVVPVCRATPPTDTSTATPIGRRSLGGSPPASTPTRWTSARSTVPRPSTSGTTSSGSRPGCSGAPSRPQTGSGGCRAPWRTCWRRSERRSLTTRSM